MSNLINILRVIKHFFIFKDFRRAKFSYYAYMYDYSNISDHLLMSMICYYAHHLEKSIKYNYEEGSLKGKEKKKIVDRLLNEYYKRNIKEDEILNWVKDISYIYNNRKELHIDKFNYSNIPIEKADEFSKIISDRTSCRFWENKIVCKELVDKILKISYSAPTSCNRQELRFIVRLKDKFDKNIGDSSNASMFKKAPVSVFLVSDNRFFPETYACALDSGAIAQTLLVSAWLYNLRGCWVHEYTRDFHTSIRKELNLKSYETVYSTVFLGYPLDFPKKPPRLSTDFLVKYI